jgi:hypothetical protein
LKGLKYFVECDKLLEISQPTNAIWRGAGQPFGTGAIGEAKHANKNSITSLGKANDISQSLCIGVPMLRYSLKCFKSVTMLQPSISFSLASSSPQFSAEVPWAIITSFMDGPPTPSFTSAVGAITLSDFSLSL